MDQENKTQSKKNEALAQSEKKRGVFERFRKIHSPLVAVVVVRESNSTVFFYEKEKKVFLAELTRIFLNAENGVGEKVAEQAMGWCVRQHVEEIILLVNAPIAGTCASWQGVERVDSRDPIDRAELEERTGSALWNFFDNERGRIALRLGVEESEVVLVDATLPAFALDEHEVKNPLGFSPTKLSLLLELVASSNSMLTFFKPFFEKAQLLKIEDRARVLARAFQETTKVPFLFVAIEKNITQLFLCKEGAFQFVDAIRWGVDELVNAIAKSFALELTVAERLYDRIRSGAIAPRMLRELRILLQNEFSLFLRGVSPHAARVSSIVCVSSFPLLSFLTSSRVAREILGGARWMNIDENWVVQATGMEIGNKEDWEARLAFEAFLRSSGRDIMDAMVRRQARWLTAR